VREDTVCGNDIGIVGGKWFGSSFEVFVKCRVKKWNN
jgi:hypothetical protein